jgi:hypothetical protein
MTTQSDNKESEIEEGDTVIILKNHESKGFLTFIGIVILLCALFEVGILAFAYFNADKVSCNLLWCTFTTERSSSHSYSSSECYMNGVKVNCSESVDVDKIMDEAFNNK